MEFELTFPYRARYSMLGSLETASELWFVLHGYGQLAPFFIKKFEPLLDRGHAIVAPEGLNRFYLQQFSGRVGANWMTKEARLTDIENYINYLNAVYNQVAADKDFKINLLGFSQGTATLSRWIAQSELVYDRLILWAGQLAHDMDIDRHGHRFSKKPIYFVYGTQDEFITSARLQEQYAVIKKLGISPRELTFEGGHDIHMPTLEHILNGQ